jgi:hypothetical protein
MTIQVSEQMVVNIQYTYTIPMLLAFCFLFAVDGWEEERFLAMPGASVLVKDIMVM